MPFSPEFEPILGLGILVGSGIGSYAAIKKWPFWKNLSEVASSLDKVSKPQAEKCLDGHCHDLVITTATKVEILEKAQVTIFAKLDDMPDIIIKRLREHKGLI